MKTYLLHHTPKNPNQDTWAIAFSLPYIASQYVRTGEGIWYVKTWLTADQIQRRLAILFDSADEMRVHELSRADQGSYGHLDWKPGRLDDEDTDQGVSAPRAMWEALHSAVQTFLPVRNAPAAMAASAGNLRAA